jgi:hypothetical protein
MQPPRQNMKRKQGKSPLLRQVLQPHPDHNNIQNKKMFVVLLPSNNSLSSHLKVPPRITHILLLIPQKPDI